MKLATIAALSIIYVGADLHIAFAAEPGFTVTSPPAVCNRVTAAGIRFERVYDTRVASDILPAGERYLSELTLCDVAFLFASADFPSSDYLATKRTAFNQIESLVQLRLGYAALRAKKMPAAKTYFLNANRTAAFIGASASADDQAEARDTMKKSKDEADRLERDGF